MEYCEYPVHAWSRYRHHLRRQCPRKAQLYCCEARKGADSSSENPYRLLHDLRRRIPLKTYLNRIFDQLVRSIFYQYEDENAEISSGKLRERLQHRFDRELELMINGVAAKDHQVYFISELQDRVCNISALIAGAGKYMDTLCISFDRELRQLISATPYLFRRDIASPLAVHINDLCCYCAPLFALEKNGELWIIENNCDEPSALLHKFHAVNCLGREPHLIRSFAYCRESGDFTEAGIGLNVSETLRRISEESAVWAELTALPPDEVTADPEHCPECEFNFFCTNIFKLEKER